MYLLIKEKNKNFYRRFWIDEVRESMDANKYFELVKDQIDINKIEEILSDRKNVHCKIINIQSLPIK